MSSGVFVRRGRNNLRDDRKGSWQGPVSDTMYEDGGESNRGLTNAGLSDSKARPFRFSDDSIQNNTPSKFSKASNVVSKTSKTLEASKVSKASNLSNASRVLEASKISKVTQATDIPKVLNETESSDVSKLPETKKEPETSKISETLKISETSKISDTSKTLEKTKTLETSKEAEAPNTSETPEALKEASDFALADDTTADKDESKAKKTDYVASTNSLDDIDLDEIKVENASGEWVEYHTLKERIALFDFRDRGFLIKAFVAVFLIITIFFFSLQCVILKSEYDKINDRLVALQDEFNEYRSSLETLRDITESDLPLSDAAETVSVVSKQSPGTENAVRYVYLTFDDGPSPYTDEILDILASYEVKATFFVCGKSGYDDMYRRIVDEGHTIGMHSYSHDYKVLYESLDSFQTDLHKIQNYIFDITGVWTTYYRFPGGSSNTASQVPMADLIGYLDRNNITYYDWNVYGGDNIASDIIVSNVVANITEHENCMILLHDAGDKEETVEALPEIIEYIQSLPNTVIVPVNEDTVPVQHSKNQENGG